MIPLARHAGVRGATAILASALLCGLYAHGAWPLGFVALVPWLLSLDPHRAVWQQLLSAWAMTVAFTAAVFAWFGMAIGTYTQLDGSLGLAVLLLLAPLFQPQFLALVLVRHLAGPRRAVAALAGAAAWVATEAFVPKLLGDTLGHGLYPSALLRQAADLFGAAGLTLLLLLVNEALTAAIQRRQGGGLRPLACAAAIPLLLAAYGLRPPPPDTGPTLRVGLVQSNISDYERLRREKGTGAVVREVLDTHYAMSYDAVERQHADAVLWSETVYPTTFGRPKSEAGAELDAEIVGIVNAAQVPFVIGSFDRDAAGEYNAAAFIEPGAGLLGLYRKTRPFPLTEHVPAWLDGPLLRRWLPWAGSWQAGSGARVFPLRLKDGREVVVQPLICLDDVDSSLAIDGARLGAQALFTLSNDAWFSHSPQGQALHHGVAAFRSIETRLPQFRVTTNGLTTVIDRRGTTVASARSGEPALVMGELATNPPPLTLMVAWGDWVGRACAGLLALLLAGAALRRWWPASVPVMPADTLPADVALLPTWARWLAGTLRTFARASLLVMAARIVLGDEALQANTLAQLRAFSALFIAPELAAWCLLRAFAARASFEGTSLVFERGTRRVEIARAEIATIEPWRLPLPSAGATLRLIDGERWQVAIADPRALGARAASQGLQRLAESHLVARHGRWQQPLLKFGLLPLLLAVPAFRLHQHIAFGSTFGEFYSFGLFAYLQAFALWWAAWAMGVALCAAVLRLLIEVSMQAALVTLPAQSHLIRHGLERAALAILYLGLPAWLLARLLAA